jgi:uncharacterized protein with HEPN domain
MKTTITPDKPKITPDKPKITPNNKLRFRAAIEKIGIMRQIYNQGWMALNDPINLYAFIHCMENIGELLNPAQTTHDSIFQNTPQVPWLRIARIRNLLGHKYHQDFRNHTFLLFQTMEDYDRLEQQLLYLSEATTLDTSLSDRLSETRYSNDHTPPNKTFANQLEQQLSIPDLTPDDLKTRLSYMLETLTVLQNIITSYKQSPNKKIIKLLAIKRCLQVIGQIIKEIPIEPYQQQITSHFLKHGQAGHKAFSMWGKMYDIRINIAHAETSTKCDEKDLLTDANDVLLFTPTIQYLLDLNQKKLQLFSENDSIIKKIDTFLTQHTQIELISQENFDVYVTTIDSHISQLIKLEAILDELNQKNNDFLVEASQLSLSSTQIPYDVTILHHYLEKLFLQKKHISESITHYQKKLIDKKIQVMTEIKNKTVENSQTTIAEIEILEKQFSAEKLAALNWNDYQNAGKEFNLKKNLILTIIENISQLISEFDKINSQLLPQDPSQISQINILKLDIAEYSRGLNEIITHLKSLDHEMLLEKRNEIIRKNSDELYKKTASILNSIKEQEKHIQQWLDHNNSIYLSYLSSEKTNTEFEKIQTILENADITINIDLEQLSTEINTLLLKFPPSDTPDHLMENFKLLKKAIEEQRSLLKGTTCTIEQYKTERTALLQHELTVIANNLKQYPAKIQSLEEFIQLLDNQCNPTNPVQLPKDTYDQWIENLEERKALLLSQFNLEIKQFSVLDSQTDLLMKRLQIKDDQDHLTVLKQQSNTYRNHYLELKKQFDQINITFTRLSEQSKKRIYPVTNSGDPKWKNEEFSGNSNTPIPQTTASFSAQNFSKRIKTGYQEKTLTSEQDLQLPSQQP